MLARCGGGDPGNMITGSRCSLVGLGVCIVSVGMIKSLGLGVLCSGVGGTTSIVMIGTGSFSFIIGFGLEPPPPPSMAVSVGVISASDSTLDLSLCISRNILAYRSDYEHTR